MHPTPACPCDSHNRPSPRSIPDPKSAHVRPEDCDRLFIAVSSGRWRRREQGMMQLVVCLQAAAALQEVGVTPLLHLLTQVWHIA